MSGGGGIRGGICALLWGSCMESVRRPRLLLGNSNRMLSLPVRGILQENNAMSYMDVKQQKIIGFLLGLAETG